MVFSVTGSERSSAYRSNALTSPSRSLKPSRGAPSSSWPGSRFIQFSVLSRNESQRCERHVSPIRPRSTTTKSRPSRWRKDATARPACPAPTTTESSFITRDP